VMHHPTSVSHNHIFGVYLCGGGGARVCRVAVDNGAPYGILPASICGHRDLCYHCRLRQEANDAAVCHPAERGRPPFRSGPRARKLRYAMLHPPSSKKSSDPGPDTHLVFGREMFDYHVRPFLISYGRVRSLWEPGRVLHGLHLSRFPFSNLSCFRLGALSDTFRCGHGRAGVVEGSEGK
jgi:hypothetical protein